KVLLSQKYAKNKKLATQFADFVSSKQGKDIIKKYGFNTP
ncbi:molybdate ABC transporter substrate-binding protein, partial [Campylobacter jejuni]|nr:molybdate ABC transporter substrate-binding protein [Campylobacter jejuni]